MNIRSTALRQACRYSVHLLLFNLLFAVAAHAAAVTGQLTVKQFAGAVKLKADNRWIDPEPGMTVILPATVSTGDDGSIALTNGETTISVASNTALELFPGSNPAHVIKRVVQSKGSAFYDVESRAHDKLRVETPYLVAVVKGTKFNVTVAAESTSVALFQGLLQIEAPDIGDVVEMPAGHIAKRHKGDRRISILNMKDGQPVSRESSAPAPGNNGSGGPTLASGDDNGADGSSVAGRNVPLDGPIDLSDGGSDGGALNGDPATIDSGIPPAPDSDGVEVVARELPASVDPEGADAATQPDTDQGAGVTLPGIDISDDLKIDDTALGMQAEALVDAGQIDTDVDAGADVDLGAGDVDIDLAADVSVAGDTLDVGVDAGADVDLGTGNIGVDLAADVGVAGDTLDVGVDAGAGVDLGTGDVGADLAADVGVAGDTLDVGVDAGAGVDLGTGDVGADLAADVGVAGDTLDVGVDAGAGVDLGTGDVGADLAADVGVAGDTLDVGVDAGAGVDLGTGDVGADLAADVGVAGDTLDVGVDAGAGVDLGTGDVGADLAADVGVAGDTLDVGVDAGAGVDLGTGDVGADLAADVGVAGDTLDVGVDVGLDTGADGGAGLTVGLDLGQLDVVTDVVGGLLGGDDTAPATDDDEDDEDDTPSLLPDLRGLLKL